MKLDAVIALFPDLKVIELTTWVEHQWVRPQMDTADGGQSGWTFHEIDIARVRLIYDLRRNLNVPDDTLPLLLSLLDQLYDLRRKLTAVGEALEEHPREVRDPLMQIIRDGEDRT